MPQTDWNFAIDVGGTFTDCYARGPDGRQTRTKLLSTPGVEGPLQAIRRLMGISDDQPIPPISLRLGTTRGTNALLTRTGAKTVLVTTAGFGDLLEIGYQDRPHLFDLTVRKHRPLIDRVLEVSERIAADGTTLITPQAAEIQSQLQQLRDAGYESLAICLLHADLFPQHEILVEELARAAGFCEISRSSAVAPLVKVVARAETTVVDAYLNPVLADYLGDLQEALPGSNVLLMTSAGGLTSPESFRGHESVLSGPAGGVVGYAQAAGDCGYDRAIGFDMGGTSTDVSRYDGAYDYQFESHKAGARIITPTLAIDTVAAGGGSLCRFDGAKLCVGPQSAGADPGPACYGRGGPLAVTDVNLFLGRIIADRFPLPTDRGAVEQRLQEAADQVAAATGEQLTLVEVAEGFLRIANTNMAQAVHNVTVAKGADPRDYVLAAFGGAAGQHACDVAAELGIRTILIDADAGILSARGIAQADVARHGVRGIYQPLDTTSAESLETIFNELCDPAIAELQAAGFTPEQIDVQRSIDLRYAGVDAALNVSFEAFDALAEQFGTLHCRRFGYDHGNRKLEVVAARTTTIAAVGGEPRRSSRVATTPAQSAGSVEAYFSGCIMRTPLFERARMQPGDFCDGPAIIVEDLSVTVVQPGWRCEVMSGGELLLEQSDEETADNSESPSRSLAAPDAVLLEIFNNLFAGVAERMGHLLRQTASSVNVKERLDYSCAVFTHEGSLVANAPHVPVHLGAMGATVRSVLADFPNPRPGDCFVTNDPYRGGSHLPDVTVVMPVHNPTSGELSFFTACRAHHAEIGGARPGSMPPASTRLGEEGVVISNFQLISDGENREQELRQLLGSGPYPSRNVAENLNDLRAQVAAARQGAADLLELAARHGFGNVQRQMAAVTEAAEAKVATALRQLAGKAYRRTDYLETVSGQSIPIAVEVTIPLEGRPTIDFSGTHNAAEGNLNANPAIVSAATLYVLRLLVDEDIPLNEGALRAVQIRIPPGLLHPPRAKRTEDSPAVAAGNVETSQRIVDVLLGALQLAAASQGTMNNLLLGSEQFGYYETIAGGSGATASGPGADAVQVHMTNTRATDPEVLERRLPLRLWESRIRRGSGGAGLQRGGDGVVRRLEFLAPLELSLITQRRGPHPPFGLAGGDDGLCGKNTLFRVDGSRETLPGIGQTKVQPGDILVIETPGGGGYGRIA